MLLVRVRISNFFSRVLPFVMFGAIIYVDITERVTLFITDEIDWFYFQMYINADFLEITF